MCFNEKEQHKQVHEGKEQYEVHEELQRVLSYKDLWFRASQRSFTTEC